MSKHKPHTPAAAEPVPTTPPPAPPAVAVTVGATPAVLASVRLVDAGTGATLATFPAASGSLLVDLGKLGPQAQTFTIVADTAGAVGVGFVLTDSTGTVRVNKYRGLVPFSLNGRGVAAINPPANLRPGQYRLVLTPFGGFSSTAGTGTLPGAPVTLTVNVVATSPDPAPNPDRPNRVSVSPAQWDGLTLKSDTEYVLQPGAVYAIAHEKRLANLRNIGIGAEPGTPFDQLPVFGSTSVLNQLRILGGAADIDVHDLRFDAGPRTNGHNWVKIGRDSIDNNRVGTPVGRVTLRNVFGKGGGGNGLHLDDTATQLLEWIGGGLWGDVGGYATYGECGTVRLVNFNDNDGTNFYRSTCGDRFDGPSHIIRHYIDKLATYSKCSVLNRNGSPGGAAIRVHTVDELGIDNCTFGGQWNRFGSLNNHEPDGQQLIKKGTIADTTFVDETPHDATLTGNLLIAYGAGPIDFVRCHWRMGNIRPITVNEKPTAQSCLWKPPPFGSFTDCDFYWESTSGVMVSGDDGRHWKYTNVRATNPSKGWKDKIWPANGIGA